MIIPLIIMLIANFGNQSMKQLTPEEKRVIVDKGTEAPFSGKYYNTFKKGTYICRRCGAPLYRSSDKFDSGCGWPSFDDEIPGAVTRVKDADGSRTEISCAKCGAHLGHVFSGEGFTKKDTRHCVNSVSLEFVPQKKETAIFAGGCFWGVEYLLQQQKGVISVTNGYIGGTLENPSYSDVSEGNTGYAEAVEVIYDAGLTDYETLARFFFEIHDPTQVDRQGPDVGNQYRSEIFYENEKQKNISMKLIQILKEKGYKVSTRVTKATRFWPAENYHQDYYARKGGQPYCHRYVKRF